MRTPFLLLSLLFAACAGGCIDDPLLLSDDPIPLTEGEAELLGLGIWRQAMEARLAVEADTAGPVDGSGPAQVPRPFAASTTVVEPCALSGDIRSEVGLQGFVDEETQEVELEFIIVQQHEDCREAEGDITYTLVGAPDITTDLILAIRPDGTLEAGGGIDGATVIITGGRSLVCEVDLDFGGGLDAEGVGTITLTGTMCGQAVAQAVSQGLPT